MQIIKCCLVKQALKIIGTRLQSQKAMLLKSIGETGYDVPRNGKGEAVEAIADTCAVIRSA